MTSGYETLVNSVNWRQALPSSRHVVAKVVGQRKRKCFVARLCSGVQNRADSAAFRLVPEASAKL
jgi:hypothetical protein